MAARPIILACAMALPLLAACGSGKGGEGGVLGARGPTVNNVRGAAPASADEALRPEEGNIWSEGLTPSQSLPNR
jgi:hypothetical protein